VALSVVLLISAGLLIRSFSAMLRERPGFDPRGVTVAQIWIPRPNNPDANHYLNPPQRARLARELVQRLEAAPGVQSVAVGLTTSVPFLSTRALNFFNLIAFSFPGNATSDQEEYTVDFGVVGDVLDHGLDQAPEPRLYGSILQRSRQLFAVFLRTSANLTTTRQLVTRTMEQIDPELPVYGVTTMDELISSSMARRRLAL